MHKRAILFDIDGTLVDSNDAHAESWQRAFAAEGYVFSRSQIDAQIGKGGDNLVPSMIPGADADVIARLSRAQGAIYKHHYMRNVVPFDGARQILRRLAERGHTLVLASSASRTEVDFYVDLLDAGGLLTGTTSKDDVVASKPCPDIFLTALELTGRRADSAVVIGDSPYDIEAARRAGLMRSRCSREASRASKRTWPRTCACLWPPRRSSHCERFGPRGRDEPGQQRR